jgi:DNA-binding PucR family transcriptional regulator
MISSKHDTIDNFLIRLLMGSRIPANDVRSYVETIRWNAKPYHYIMVLCPLELENVPTIPLYDILEDTRTQVNCHSLIFDSRVICICSVDHPVDCWNSELPVLEKIMQNYHLFAGISQSFENPSLMSSYYKQAKSTAEIAGILKNQSLFYCYNYISIYYLLSMLPANTDLRQFCNEKILALENYDTEHNSELVPTLHAYLESRCSVSKTASKLFVHRNTINYRIRKCYEILDTDLENGDDFFSCIFSLRILEYANKKMGRMPQHYQDILDARMPG